MSSLLTSSFFTSDFQPRAVPRVLSIAGSDSSGGAGIQADIKAISVCGGYAMTAITALTAQNTQGVQSVYTPPANFLRDQLDAVASDVTIDAVKIGMLATAELTQTVGQWLQETKPSIVVLDPVMVATSGADLIEDGATRALLDLCRLATVVTPNAAELGVLTSHPTPETWEDALELAQQLADQTATAVLVKGGHLAGDVVRDGLVVPGETEPVWMGESPRHLTNNTHGTGCSLSSSLATTLAQTGEFTTALERSKNWINQAIAAADELEVGQGHGPIHHFYALAGESEDYPVNTLEPSLAELRENFSGTVYEAAAKVRQRVDRCEFVQRLGAGTLPIEAFTYYLDQDALYLTQYSRALSRCSALAPEIDARLFFGGSAVEAIVVESEMHRNWTARFSDSPMVTGKPGTVTKTYTDFLLSSSAENYPVAIAAVLPCYWLYADIGRHLAQALENYEGEHPYGEWLATYGAEDFQEAAQSAINYVDRAARTATDEQLFAMKEAFMRACRLELAFFEAPLKAACHLLKDKKVS